ncbi:condensin subunit ScpA [Arcticibacter pallidicorallinus]|uniref:Segregation and condensation protein A n=1 Tax=Arcticibacter pallidicorallinus TaxID=1259464 RepID=A0A2T0U6T0_9SPHI|nr:segregation/condensation protein A [Arcticibacter pallidicorallinus]PRY53626.1 condensin subunit ScpA [Arcticibacter pallidicorallinus]
MIHQDTYDIRLPQFEGPFDLLLFFIERDELDIHEIAIAKITDDFLAYIQEMTALNIELASEFIFIAATLMRLKAKMLLPRPEQDDEGNEIDNREDLVRKLIEYKKIKMASEEMRLLEDKRMRLQKRGNIGDDLLRIAGEAEHGEELSTFSLYTLLLMYEKVRTRNSQKSVQVTHTVVQYPYTIEQQKTAIAELLRLNARMDFSDMKKHSENRVHFIFNFLAVLEMLQQQLISIQTGIGFNNFRLESNNHPTQ